MLVVLLQFLSVPTLCQRSDHLEQNSNREKLEVATSFITNILALLHGLRETITSHEPPKKVRGETL